MVDNCLIITLLFVFLFQMISKVRRVSVCCQGYTRSDNGTTCVPVCSQQCVHGTCTAPDTCMCKNGYGGSDCSKCKSLLTF